MQRSRSERFAPERPPDRPQRPGQSRPQFPTTLQAGPRGLGSQRSTANQDQLYFMLVLDTRHDPIISPPNLRLGQWEILSARSGKRGGKRTAGANRTAGSKMDSREHNRQQGSIQQGASCATSGERFIDFFFAPQTWYFISAPPPTPRGPGGGTYKLRGGHL